MFQAYRLNPAAPVGPACRELREVQIGLESLGCIPTSPSTAVGPDGAPVVIQRINPMTVVRRPEVDELSLEDAGKVTRHIVDPATPAVLTQKLAHTRHNFQLFLVNAPRNYPPESMIHPRDVDRRAVNLVLNVGLVKWVERTALESIKALRALARREGRRPTVGRESRIGLYTPFEILHRLGDATTSTDYPSLSLPLEAALELLPNVALSPADHGILHARLHFTTRVGDMVGLHPADLEMVWNQMWLGTVNSKMAREGYAADDTEVRSDVVALAEMTPPNRPLLVPYTPEQLPARMAFANALGDEERRRVVDEIEATLAHDPRIAPALWEAWAAFTRQFNAHFRSLYSRGIHALYGRVVEI